MIVGLLSLQCTCIQTARDGPRPLGWHEGSGLHLQRMMGGMSPSQMAEMQQAASGIRGGLGMPASVAPAARPLQPDLSAASAAVKVTSCCFGYCMWTLRSTGT